MTCVFVLDTNKQHLNPVHPGRARLLLKERKAAVFKGISYRSCQPIHRGDGYS